MYNRETESLWFLTPITAPDIEFTAGIIRSEATPKTASTDITDSAPFWIDRAYKAYKTTKNTIQNSRQISVNGQFNFVNLYNKIPYLKKINSSGKGRGRGGRGGKDSKAVENKSKKSSTDKGIKPLEEVAKLAM